MLEKDIMEWEEQMKQFSNVSVSPEYLEKACPPVRTAVNVELNKGAEKASDDSQNGNKSKFKPKTPLSYSYWDKLDVEKELKKVENDVQKEKENEVKKCKVTLQPYLDTSGLSEKERRAVADKEKLKGNEAFKVKDYAEAEIYYSRSISAFPTVAALNNRAFTNFKLKEYSYALVDCNTVLGLESNNVKALYRRGLVHKEMGSLQLAYMDFLSVLELEPENKAAKDRLQELEKNPCAISQQGNASVVIEEISSAKIDKNAGTGVVSKAVVAEKNVNHKSSNSSSPENEAALEKKSLKSRLSPQAVDFFNISENERLKGKSEKSHDSHNISAESENFYLKEKHTVRRDKSETCKRLPNKTSKLIPVPVKIVSHASHISAEDNDKVLRSSYDNIEEILQTNVSLNEHEKVFSLSKVTHKNDEEKPKTDLKNTEAITPSKDMLPDKCTSDKLLEEKPASDAGSTLCDITPFKFYTTWHNMDANNDSKTGAAILKKISPKQLPEIISNKLDGDFLYGIIKAVTVIVCSGDAAKGYEIMSWILEIPRIKTVLCFLSSSEKTDIRNIFLMFKENGIEDCNNIEKVFLAC